MLFEFQMTVKSFNGKYFFADSLKCCNFRSLHCKEFRAGRSQSSLSILKVASGTLQWSFIKFLGKWEIHNLFSFLTTTTKKSIFYLKRTNLCVIEIKENLHGLGVLGWVFFYLNSTEDETFCFASTSFSRMSACDTRQLFHFCFFLPRENWKLSWNCRRFVYTFKSTHHDWRKRNCVMFELSWCTLSCDPEMFRQMPWKCNEKSNGKRLITCLSRTLSSLVQSCCCCCCFFWKIRKSKFN